ncbi:MAG: acyl-CoA dehydrogenase domain-containing protein, partial [Desulfuromonadales bacterium]
RTGQRYYRKLNRYAAALAVLADAALLLLGGGLKRKEMLSARLGDILAELYFLSAVLKRWHDEGRLEEDLVLVDFAMSRGYAVIENRLKTVLANLPNRLVAIVLQFILMPLGVLEHGPSDRVVKLCAEILLSPSASRDRVTAGLFLEPGANASVAELEQAFDLVCETETLYRRLHDAQCTDREEALAKGLLSEAEAARLKQVEDAVARVLAVDDFPAEELGESNFSPATDNEDQRESP